MIFSTNISVFAYQKTEEGFTFSHEELNQMINRMKKQDKKIELQDQKIDNLEKQLSISRETNDLLFQDKENLKQKINLLEKRDKEKDIQIDLLEQKVEEKDLQISEYKSQASLGYSVKIGIVALVGVVGLSLIN
jgi:predicted nuclease with TOPRIM domain